MEQLNYENRTWKELANARMSAWTQVENNPSQFARDISEALTEYKDQEDPEVPAEVEAVAAEETGKFWVIVIIGAYILWGYMFGYADPVKFLLISIGVILACSFLLKRASKIPHPASESHCLEALSGNKGWVLFWLISNYSTQCAFDTSTSWQFQIKNAINRRSYVEVFALCLHGLRSNKDVTLIRKALADIGKSANGGPSFLLREDFVLLKSFAAFIFLVTYTRSEAWPQNAQRVLNQISEVEPIEHAVNIALHELEADNFVRDSQTVRLWRRQLASNLKDYGWYSNNMTELENVDQFLNWFEHMLHPSGEVGLLPPVIDDSCDVAFDKKGNRPLPGFSPSITAAS